MKLMFDDPETKLPSTTRTIFFYGCLVCLVRLGLSDVSIINFHIPHFTGGDFGMSIAALGGIYSLDKHISNIHKENL